MKEAQEKPRRVDRFPYLKEYEVYALWKFANPALTRRDVFQFRDFVPANTFMPLATNFLIDHLILWEVALPNLVFHKESYLKYGAGQDKLKEYLSNNKDKPNAKFLQNILDNKFGLLDIRKSPFHITDSLLEFIEFDKDLAKKELQKVSSFLDTYIDEYIKDNLEKDEENYLHFENQLKRTLYILRGLQDKYGKEIVVRFNPETDLTFDGGYLFVHSIVAAEKLGYIKVISAWEEDDVIPEKQTEDYKIKLFLLKGEIQKENSISESQNIPEITSKGINGYFKFKKNGNPIFVSRTTSKPYKLLKSLIYPSGTYKSVESVFEDVYEKKERTAPDLLSPLTSHSLKLKKIEGVIKELQRIEEFQEGRLRFEFTPDNKRQIRLIVGL